MARTTVRQNYLKGLNLLLNNCSDATDWTASGSGIAFIDSTDHVLVGTGSQKLIIPDGQATGLSVNSLTGMGWDLSPYNQINFKVGWDITAANRQLDHSFQILLGSNAGNQFADYILSKTIFTGEKPYDEVYSFDLNSAIDFPSSAGSFDRTSVQWCSIRINNTDTAGEKVFYLDAVYAGLQSKTQVLLTFDDADSSVYTAAFPIMQTYGLVSTQYVNGGTVGGTGKMTVAQLKEMEAAGHQISNHSYDHVSWLGKTKEYMRANFLTNKNWLIANGFNDWAYFAYVGGYFNDDSLDLMTEQNVITARSVESSLTSTYALGNFGTSHGLLNPHLLRTDNLGVTETELASVELGYLDTAIKNGYSHGMYAHKIVTTPVLTTEFSIAEFTDLCAGIAARKTKGLCEDRTIKEYINGLNGIRPLAA